MILAIVGATKFHNDRLATEWAIASILSFLKPLRITPGIECVISGGADGIDKLAVDLACYLYLPWAEFLPVEDNWKNGYKPRNMIIAQSCTHMLQYSHYKSVTYGSGWTADYAEKLGKRVKRYTYEIQSDGNRG